MSMESKVLAELSEDRFSSGEEISHKLNITRSAVWKHIVKLRGRGYVIEASPRNGYRLAGRPDKLLPAEIAPLLDTRIIGSRIEHFDQVGSTADMARKFIDEGAPEGTVVVAEAQTSGRGRMGRSWETPPGKAIALSVILYPRLAPTKTPLLSLATAVAVQKAVARVVREATGAAPDIRLKWPNDVYLDGKKLAGVLVEMAAELDRVRWAIDSIGLNANNIPRGRLERNATSLKARYGRDFSRRELVAAILEELDKAYAKIRTGKGLVAVRQEFEREDLLQGKQIEVTTPEGLTSGTAVGIDDEGRLRLRVRGGEERLLFSGEATLSRAS